MAEQQIIREAIPNPQNQENHRKGKPQNESKICTNLWLIAKFRQAQERTTLPPTTRLKEQHLETIRTKMSVPTLCQGEKACSLSSGKLTIY